MKPSILTTTDLKLSRILLSQYLHICMTHICTSAVKTDWAGIARKVILWFMLKSHKRFPSSSHCSAQLWNTVWWSKRSFQSVECNAVLEMEQELCRAFIKISTKMKFHYNTVFIQPFSRCRCMTWLLPHPHLPLPK